MDSTWIIAAFQSIYGRREGEREMDAENQNARGGVKFHEGARCLDCDYLLRDLAEPRCPECGHAFSPSDPQSYSSIGRAFPGWARLLYRPPGLIMAMLPLAPIGFTLWHGRRPAGEFVAQVLGFAQFLLVGGIWGARGLAALAVGAWFERPRRMTPMNVFRWLLVPAGLLVWVIAANNLDVVQRIVLENARPQLEAVASQPALPSAPFWAGALHIRRVDRYQGGVMFLTGSGYGGSAEGYAYFPDSKPVDSEWMRFYHVKGSWWTYWDSEARGYAVTGGAPPWSAAATTQQSTTP